MSRCSKVPVGSGWKRRLCLYALLAALTLPFAASLALAEEPFQLDERKRITHKMKMEAAKNRKEMIRAMQQQQAAGQQGGSASQQQPGGAPLTPSTNPGR